MNTERIVRTFAGAVVLLTLALGVEASPLFYSRQALWVTTLVGAILFQSGLTCFCPLELILRRLGVASGGACPSSGGA